jgi:hypothetical protein
MFEFWHHQVMLVDSSEELLAEKIAHLNIN